MAPYLLPLILIIYGEFSKDINTRFLGRILFYSYACSQFIVPQLLQGNSLILGSMASFCFGVGYCVVRCRNTLSRISFGLSGICYCLNSVAMYLQDYTLLLSIPYYADVSHLIIREGLLTGIATFAVWKEHEGDKDWELAGLSLALVTMETIIY